jgi:hypothetical protein
MDDAHLDKVPPESIVSHVAQFACSSDCAVTLNLSRVSLSFCLCISKSNFCSIGLMQVLWFTPHLHLSRFTVVTTSQFVSFLNKNNVPMNF